MPLSLGRVSRRAFLVGIGSAVAGVSAVWAYGCPGGWNRFPHTVRGDSPEPCCQYVDHEGWLVTPEDKRALTGSRDR
jgi:hypothetical protein